MKICDLTQFYSPLSGGVKRYVHEKIAYIGRHSPDDEHVLIVPGPKTQVTSSPRSRIYSIHSPLLSRTSRYRALLNLRAVEEILEREHPNIIESSDPYQVGWKAIAVGRSLKIPVVGFYHSHFPEAYLRSSTKFLGRRGTHRAMKLTRAYVRKLYNRFQATLVPSELLAGVLCEWGVRNVRVVRLGVNTDVFKPVPDDGKATRASLGVGVQETFGLVALESQACGTPVMGIRGSYMDRIICHDQELWPREHTAAALADAIEGSSAKKLSLLGETAAWTAENLYSWPRVFEELFCIYREVWANYRRS